MRTVQITIRDGFDDVTAETRNDVKRAVGHLSLLAEFNPKYQSVALLGDKEGNLHATYKNEAGEVTYQIYGERAENGSYGFHS